MQHSSPPRSAPALLVVVVVVLALVAGALLVAVGREASDGSRPRLAPVADRALRASRAEVRAAQLLRAWDTRRAAAWAAGDVEALARLYAAGSGAGRRDRDMLQVWIRRGLRVEDLRTQVLDVQVLEHRPGRWVVQVVDRLVSGVAVGPVARTALPRDSPTTRRVVLVEQLGSWRVASVQAVSAARSGAPP